MPVFSLIYLQERKPWGLSTSVCSSSKWDYSQHVNHKVVMKVNELICGEHFKQCRQRGISQRLVPPIISTTVLVLEIGIMFQEASSCETEQMRVLTS